VYSLIFSPIICDVGGDPRPGPPSNPGSGTMIELKLDESGAESDDKSRWHARLVEKKGKSIVVDITPSCKAVIGEWEFHVYTMKNGADENDKKMHYEHNSDVIILLNPWCKGLMFHRLSCYVECLIESLIQNV